MPETKKNRTIRPFAVRNRAETIARRTSRAPTNPRNKLQETRRRHLPHRRANPGTAWPIELHSAGLPSDRSPVVMPPRILLNSSKSLFPLHPKRSPPISRGLFPAPFSKKKIQNHSRLQSSLGLARCPRIMVLSTIKENRRSSDMEAKRNEFREREQRDRGHQQGHHPRGRPCRHRRWGPTRGWWWQQR